MLQRHRLRAGRNRIQRRRHMVFGAKYPSIASGQLLMDIICPEYQEVKCKQDSR
jgi:hypothetical protein